MAKLERLVYGSTATGHTDNLLNMATILAESGRNNARDGLTGALAAHEGRFIQVIEGSSDAIDALLRRLATDPRHKDIVIFGRDLVEQRLFGDWVMANARITPGLKSVLDGMMSQQAPSADHVVTLMQDAVVQMDDGGDAER
ncbi:MAG: BLUF domain-containing protein [Brevundimonas sp.]|uniref:BLUF domain-containing protein n=1 Tax=Brevundimonas sp. TaxID=1871086 RepID=UPI002733038B|nr:BLUF domain-containing protein [Brevundimonas sp.]MDP3377243.1 BLUF domain-containing protein [Brevundimonas sp.]